MKNLLLLGLVFVASCIKPTYYQTQKVVMDFYYHKQYAQALEAIEHNDYIKEDFNINLYHVEKGKLLFDSGQFEEASKLLITASVNIEDWSTFFYRNLRGDKVYLNDYTYNFHEEQLHPITRTQVQIDPDAEFYDIQYPFTVEGSYSYAEIPNLKSPYVTPYINPDFERPLINYYIGLCGMETDESVTLVEAKRLNLLYGRLNTRKSPFTTVIYSPNPFIQLCAGMFYEATGNLNEAFIAYEQSLKDFQNPNCNINYGLQTPEQLKKDLITISKQLEFEDRYRDYRKRFQTTNIDLNTIQTGILFFIDVNHAPRKQLVFLNKLDTAHPERPVKYSYPFIENVSEPVTELIIEIENKEFHAEMINNNQYMLTDVSEKRMRSEFHVNTKASRAERYRNYDTRNWQTLPAQIFYARIDVTGNSSYKVKLKYKTGTEWKEKEVDMIIPPSKRMVRLQLVD